MSAQTPVLTFDVGQSSREFGGLERTQRAIELPAIISFRNVIDDANPMAKASSTAVLKCFPYVAGQTTGVNCQWKFSRITYWNASR